MKSKKESERNDHFNSYCTFTPKIMDTSSPKVGNFYRRLQTWVEKSKDQKEKLVRSASKDRKTGQQLFTPVIIVKERLVRNVFIDLHEIKDKQDKNKKEAISKRDADLKLQAESPKATPGMDDIYNTNKYQCFLSLFSFFDTDDDEAIQYDEAFVKAYEALDEDIKVIMAPLIQEFSSQCESLSRDEFVLSMEGLYKFISQDEKRRLINWYVKKNRKLKANHAEEFSFRPEISKISMKIFEKSRQHSKDIILRNIDSLEKKKSYFNKKTEEKKLAEVEGREIIYL